MKVGRNDPCPCGSGKKYKKCCMGLEEGLLKKSPYAELRDTSVAVIKILVEYAVRVLPEGSMEEAEEDFGLGAIEDNRAREAFFNELFIPWFCFHWMPDGAVPALTVAERFLAERAYKLDAYSNRYIEVAGKAPLCYWQVTEVIPAQGTSLRNMATQEEKFVPDLTASGTLAKWDIIFCQVISMNNVNNFGAIAPYSLPPASFRNGVEKFLNYIHADKKTPEELCDYDFEFIDHYLECVDRMLHPVMPKITNRDGDALVFVELTYAFSAALRPQVVAALECVKNVFREAKASDSKFVWVVKDILKAGIKVKGDLLEIECNSRKRASAIGQRLEKALDGLITFSKKEERKWSPEAAAAGAKAANSKPMDLDELPAEDRERLIASMDAIHMKWADEVVPMLGHKTPRQMVKTKKGRSLVASMLSDFEHSSMRQADSQHVFDFNELRRDLGLAEE